MLFNARFPEVLAAFSPQIFMSPTPIVVDIDEGQIMQTGRSYPCVVCNNRTVWRAVVDGCPVVPICSDECLKVFLSDGVEADVGPALELAPKELRP